MRVVRTPLKGQILKCQLQKEEGKKPQRFHWARKEEAHKLDKKHQHNVSDIFPTPHPCSRYTHPSSFY
eukprot:7329347-Ditylum_brightwellii.AAC.1